MKENDSQAKSWEGLLESVQQYYDSCLQRHGPTPRGVDWNSKESQNLRFRELLRIVDADRPFTITDYGCGYGALAEYLIREGLQFTYQGFDLSPAMIQQARKRAGQQASIQFLSEKNRLQLSDYTVASGIFNVKLQAEPQQWKKYVLESIQQFRGLSRLGFAFNMLTDQVDPGRARPDLFYADPCFFFEYCRKNFSRKVALFHDYPLFEFTILVRL